MTPEVTVIINCFNGAAFVRNAIDSIYAQTFASWEIVFWDNASTDATGEIAQSFDARLRYFRGETNVPLGHARRLAKAEARGKWIGFLDADDIWYPQKLERQIEAIGRMNAEPVLCYAGVREQRPDGLKIRDAFPRSASGDIFAEQLVQFDINMVTPLLNRARLAAFGLTFDDRIVASEEYNLFMRLLAKGPASVVPELLGVSNIRDGSLTDQAINRWAIERKLTLEMIEAENPGMRERYPEAFAAAEARALYYEARYLMSTGDVRSARKRLQQAASSSGVYKALWLLAHVPPAWKLAHNQVIKRRLSVLLGTVHRRS